MLFDSEGRPPPGALHRPRGARLHRIPKRQRGLAECQQAPASSYFCSPRKAGVSSRRSTSLSKIVHSGSHAASRPRARSPTKPPAPCACSPAQMRRPASAFGLHRRRPTRTRVHAKAELGAGRHNGWTVERRPASRDWRNPGTRPLLSAPKTCFAIGAVRVPLYPERGHAWPRRDARPPSTV
jgi:hypothetical protein